MTLMERRRALMEAQEDNLILNDLLTLDGIRNTRSGHDSSATIWQDLSGNNFDTVKIAGAGVNNLVWGNDCAIYDATNRGQYISHDFFGGRTTGSIEIIAKITGNGSYNPGSFYQGFVFSNKDSANTGFLCYSYNSGGISSFVASTTCGYSSTSSGPTYICWVFNGNTATRYVNGALASTYTIDYSELQKTNNRIGYNYNAVDNIYLGFPHCKLYRLGISSTAFDAPTIADRYKRFKKRFNI